MTTKNAEGKSTHIKGKTGKTPKTKLMITTILGLASLATIRHGRGGARTNNQEWILSLKSH